MVVDKNPDASRGNLIGAGWPSYRYGPNGESEVFHRPEDVPAGWRDAPDKPVTLPEEPQHEPAPLPHDEAMLKQEKELYQAEQPYHKPTADEFLTEALARPLPVLTRSEIAAELMRRGFTFSKNTPTKALLAKLQEEALASAHE